MSSYLSSRFCAVLLGAALAACGSASPAPDWQRNAHTAAGRATQAYLRGDDRVAELEWQRARDELARTGRPELLARLELLRCASQVASLQASGCAAFEPWRAEAGEADRAYADYLAARLPPAQWPLLPAAQQAAQQAALSGAPLPGAEADPLARLLGAAVSVRMQGAAPQTLDLAIETAAAQGWRRPLLAWLLLRLEQARAAGDRVAAARLQRRLDVVQAGAQRF